MACSGCDCCCCWKWCWGCAYGELSCCGDALCLRPDGCCKGGVGVALVDVTFWAYGAEVNCWPGA